MEKQGSTSRHVDAPPDVVFGTVTDLTGLPDWNRRILRLVEAR